MNRGAQGLPGNEYSLVRSHDESAPKLSDLGISHSMSSRAQAIANVPEEEFEAVIADHRDQQRELTSNTIRKRKTCFTMKQVYLRRTIAGEMNQGARGQLQGKDSSGGSMVKPPEKTIPTLSDMGITKSMSSRVHCALAR